MGYESKIVVVDRSDIWDGYIVGGTIAVFNLSGINWNPQEIFTEKIDFDLFVDGECTRVDKYGRHCYMADIDDVVKVLENMAEKESYRRFAPVIGLLKGFEQQRWDDLKVVHYGY